MKILVLDDNPLVLAVLDAMLRKNGWEVVAALNLADLDARHPNGTDGDLVISNIHLGAESGISAAKKLQDRMPRLRVLLTSGLPPQYVGDEQWTDLQRLRSGYGFLQKPFTADSLRSTIEQFLREPQQEAADAAAN